MVDTPPSRPRLRPVPLACYDVFDDKHVQVLYAREVTGGDKGQLPGQLELVLVELEAPELDQAKDPQWWHELDVSQGREIMAKRFAMIRHVETKQR